MTMSVAIRSRNFNEVPEQPSDHTQMTMSIATVAQKALRRLGVRIVPLDEFPDLGGNG